MKIGRRKQWGERDKGIELAVLPISVNDRSILPVAWGKNLGNHPCPSLSPLPTLDPPENSFDTTFPAKVYSDCNYFSPILGPYHFSSELLSLLTDLLPLPLTVSLFSTHCLEWSWETAVGSCHSTKSTRWSSLLLIRVITMVYKVMSELYSCPAHPPSLSLHLLCVYSPLLSGFSHTDLLAVPQTLQKCSYLRPLGMLFSKYQLVFLLLSHHLLSEACLNMLLYKLQLHRV